MTPETVLEAIREGRPVSAAPDGAALYFAIPAPQLPGGGVSSSHSLAEEIAPDKLRVLDLFSGIGGFSLGLERTGGFETVAFCEIETFPRKVLAKHWPEVPIYDDVRTLTAERLAADGIAVDVICGGFPCQDISYAGLGAGLDGDRSGLFFEIARLIGELGPGHVILENVGALLSRGLDAVLGTLASLGYDAEWHCIPASALGAHHRRDRVWIVAYPRNDGHRTDDRFGKNPGAANQGAGEQEERQRVWSVVGRGCEAVAHASGDGRTGSAVGDQGRNAFAPGKLQLRIEPAGNRAAYGSGAVADAMLVNEQGIVASFAHPQEWARQVERSARPRGDGFAGWRIEPDVGRVAHGVPDRAHRLKALGNAVVPQIPELIGNAILASLTLTGGVGSVGAGALHSQPIGIEGQA